MVDTVLTRVDSLNYLVSNILHPHPILLGLSLDELVAICSIIIALCALFISIYESWLSRKQFGILSEPALKFIGYFHKDNETIGLLLENKGPGAAQIKDFKVTFNGRTSKCTEDFKNEITTLVGVSMKAGTLGKDSIIRSGDNWWLLSIKNSEVNNEQIKKIDDLCCKQMVFKITCKTCMGKIREFNSTDD